MPDSLALVREHRGMLDDSLKTTKLVVGKAHLLRIIKESLRQFCPEPLTVIITPYGYDARIKWDTHLITIKGYGVWGMSNGPIEDNDAE